MPDRCDNGCTSTPPEWLEVEGDIDDFVFFAETSGPSER